VPLPHTIAVHAPPLQYGVPPPHALSCHCPLASQVCSVVVEPDLQRFCPAVHTLQAPALQVPLSPATAQAAPSALLPKPQVPEAQVACRQGELAAGHWLAPEHCTHEPVAGSQFGVVPVHAGCAAY